MPARQATSPATDISDPAGAGHYIASLSADLATLARAHGLDTLGYLLDMARLEADNVARDASQEQ